MGAAEKHVQNKFEIKNDLVVLVEESNRLVLLILKFK